jgi:serine/threonine protein kinase
MSELCVVVSFCRVPYPSTKPLLPGVEPSMELQEPDQGKETERVPSPSPKPLLPHVEPSVELQELDQDILPHILNMDWEMDRRDITLRGQLGVGEFGPIYDAEVQLGLNMTSRAVVKVFQKGTSQDLVRFREEVEEIKHLEHPNVGRVLGMVTGHTPYYQVLELTVNGDLKTFLLAASRAAAPHPGLSHGQLVALVTDVAAGLAYMESMDYVHRDVAARNCIVTQNLSAKITDFKLGRYLHRSEYAVENSGSLMPLRWMAPESIARHKYTSKSTVWSFGVLLWEVMGRGGFPYQELGDGEVVIAVCYTRLPLPQPLHCPNNLYREMLQCWNSRASKRPLMEDLHQRLKSSILTNTYPQ